MRIIIATIRPWHIHNAILFKEAHPEYEVKLIFDKDEFVTSVIDEFCPDYIMCPHWSWIIPSEIFSKYKCIVYHTSDVPNARGGSPIQNQIADGIDNTMISAIAVEKGLDTGKVYMKRPLNLQGSAEEIFIRSSKIIFEDMIPYIIEYHPEPTPQIGKGYLYKRRTYEQSALPLEGDLQKLFDHIRMLDAPEYPLAYVDYGEYRLEFSRAKLCLGEIVADVRIKKKNG